MSAASRIKRDPKGRLVCRHCSEVVIERIGKPGFIDECDDCADDVDRLIASEIKGHDPDEINAADFSIITPKLKRIYPPLIPETLL